LADANLVLIFNYQITNLLNYQILGGNLTAFIKIGTNLVLLFA